MDKLVQRLFVRMRITLPFIVLLIPLLFSTLLPEKTRSANLPAHPEDLRSGLRRSIPAVDPHTNQQDPKPEAVVEQGHSFKPVTDGVRPAAAGITQLSLTTKDIVYDPFRDVIYASIPSNATAFANTVITINPTSGVTGNAITTGDSPGRLALSGDGQYLYVSH